MNTNSASGLITEGLRCHKRSDLQRAEQCYLAVLERYPDHTEALYLLGTLKAQQGDFASAGKYLEKVMAIRPTHTGASLTLGNIAFETQCLDQAARHYQAALEGKPQLVDALFGLGKVHLASGRNEDACRYFEQVLTLSPRFDEAQSNLGIALSRSGRHPDAIRCFRETLRRQPQLAEINAHLGESLLAMGKLEEAAAAYRVLIEADPDSYAAYNNLGNIYRTLSQHEEAGHCYRKAIALKPDLSRAHNNLGNIHKVRGQDEQALSCYRRAMELDPAFWQAHSNLLLCLNYLPDYEPKQLFDEHVRWGAIHAPADRMRQHHPNVRECDRRLRVGYVSPDMRVHAVATFFEPLIENHNPQEVEIFCYAEVPRPDATTERLRSLASGWCDTVGMTDDELAQRIYQDHIDILVDLAGHTANSRLPVFGYRPAPVQVSYLGYPNTTGVEAINYRFTDVIADPDGSEPFYSEELVRLEGGLTRYRAPEHTPEVGPLPAATSGIITFGSLNNLVKMNEQVLDLWSQVLHAVPGSRLLLFRDMLQDTIKEQYREWFADRGLGPDRVELRGERVSTGAHLAVYNEIDIALDPFPWNGHVSSCEALWMGVPVVTLAGPTHAGRLCASVLHQLALDELVADSPGQYVGIASALATDRRHLSALRENLRRRMQQTVCDGGSLARAVEKAYREMWRRWCSAGSERG